MLLSPIAYFCGGVFLANALPHLVSGLTGRAFQTPFARPPGRGLSSPVVNVLWAFGNLIIAYFLVLQVGVFDLRKMVDAAAFGLGACAISVFLAWHFGRLHSGAASARS